VTAMKRAVIVGASGMVGCYALRYLLEDPAVVDVTSIGRRNLGISQPKLTEILHSDFADCTPLANALTGLDAAVYCLGAYTGAVPDDEFHRITVDYTVEFARVLRASSPNATFACLVIRSSRSGLRKLPLRKSTTPFWTPSSSTSESKSARLMTT